MVKNRGLPKYYSITCLIMSYCIAKDDRAIPLGSFYPRASTVALSAQRRGIALCYLPPNSLPNLLESVPLVCQCRRSISLYIWISSRWRTLSRHREVIPSSVKKSPLLVPRLRKSAGGGPSTATSSEICARVVYPLPLGSQSVGSRP